MIDIERMLERRRAEVTTLTRERDRLRRQLDALDDKIRSLAGNSATTAMRTTRSGRARNEMSLLETLMTVMGKVGKPMKVGDIVAAVVKSGYQSSVANFRGLINQTLIRERKRFTNTDRATYQLKK